MGILSGLFKSRDTISQIAETMIKQGLGYDIELNYVKREGNA